MVITLGSLLWNWLWAPSVMEVVWFFRLNCSLAWIYETLTVLHSRKLSSPISRLVLHLGHAKESEKVSRQPKPYRRSHGTCLSLPSWGHLPWWRLQSLWGCLQKGAQLLQLSDPLDVEEDCYTQWSSTTLSVGQWHGALTNITSVRNLLIPSTILGPVHRAALYLCILDAYTQARACRIIVYCFWAGWCCPSLLGWSTAFYGMNSEYPPGNSPCLLSFHLSTPSLPISLYSWSVENPGWRLCWSQSSWHQYAWQFFLFSLAF